MNSNNVKSVIIDGVKYVPETELKKCFSVTSVEVYPFKDNGIGKIVGCAHILLGDQLHIRGLRIMKGKSGLYVGYPNDPFYKGDGECPITHPITKDLKQAIEDAVLAAYKESIKE